VNKSVKAEGMGLAVRLSVKLAMKKVQGSVVEEIVDQAFSADTDHDAEIDLGEWKKAVHDGSLIFLTSLQLNLICGLYSTGNQAIIVFLNPGEQIVHTIETLQEALEETGAVTNKEDLDAWKK